VKLIFDVEEVERRGCLTFSRRCVNLGMARKLEKGGGLGSEGYVCDRDFPEDCAKYGCPKYMLIGTHEAWVLEKGKVRKRG